MSSGLEVAVVGATGAVGEAMLSIMAEREFPAERVHAIASAESAGESVNYGRRSLTVQSLEDFDFSQVALALFSAGSAVSREFAPRAAEAGCVVIDNSSEFRYEDDVPLVVAEVNPDALAGYRTRNIIANPNCSTMQMLVAIAPIHREVGISRINLATYQSVSGAGRSGIKELAEQTAALLNFRSINPKAFQAQIAFNVIPAIDALQDNGYTREEMKAHWETQKILDDPDIAVNATCVRVPVFYGHAEAVHLETRSPIEIGEVESLLREAPGLEYVDDGGLPTPAVTAAGHDPVYVARLRRDLSHPNGLNLWVVADNVRKGAALNAVQLAELLVNHHF